ncbi:MAG TPA: response regulator transcription factor [Bryobacteraceae bacterium]|nr:response regulator transcription factor [Bryobacteraceae bacterium]
MDDSIRILLIDDHSLFREAIARLLAGQPDFHIVGECSTVDEGIGILKSAPVDIVLLDINLGLQQGGAFPKLARDEGFTGKILVVTAGVSKLEAARLLQRGCSRIILKQDRPELLIEAIRESVAGAGEHDDAAVKVDLQRLSSGPPIPNPLTSRERQVLRGVFGGLANKEIAFNLAISEPLVKSVIQQLFTKAGVRTRTQLVRIAAERYWKELEEE